MTTPPFNTAVYATAHAPLQAQNAIYRSQMNTSYVASTPTHPPPPPPPQNQYYLGMPPLNESASHHSQVLLQQTQGSSQAASHNIASNGINTTIGPQLQPQNPAWAGLGDKRMQQSLGFGNGGSGHAGIIPFGNGFHNSPSNASLSMSLHADEKIKSHASQSMGLTSSISSSQDLSASLLATQSRPGCRILATTKRAAQNRAAQRAFRQRKDRYIKDLEAKAKELDSVKRRLEQAEKEKEEMKSIMAELRAEVAKLKGEADDDKNRGETNSNSSSSINSPFTPNGSSEDDLNGLGEDPWMRKRKSAFYNERTSPAYQSPPSHPRPSTNSHADTARPPSTVTNSSTSPTNSSDASTSPTSSNNHYELNRNDYRSYPNSPTSDTRRPFNSCVNNAQSRSEDDPAERGVMMDDLCVLLRTRSHPDVHNSVGVSFWANRNPAPVVAGNGSNAVVG